MTRCVIYRAICILGLAVMIQGCESKDSTAPAGMGTAPGSQPGSPAGQGPIGSPPGPVSPNAPTGSLPMAPTSVPGAPVSSPAGSPTGRVTCDAYQGDPQNQSLGELLGEIQFLATLDLNMPSFETELGFGKTAQPLVRGTPGGFDLFAMGMMLTSTQGWSCAMGAPAPRFHQDDGFTLECSRGGQGNSQREFARVTRTYSVATRSGQFSFELYAGSSRLRFQYARMINCR